MGCRHLQEEKLFEFDKSPFRWSPGPDGNKFPRETERLWLFDVYVSTMTLNLEPHTHEVIIVPFQNGENRYSDVGSASPVESQ